MGRKKKYASAGEKQRAWRIRTGKQKAKVPLEMRRGERLGASESEIRAKKEGETWEEYHVFINRTVALARKRQEKAKGAAGKSETENGYNFENSIGAKRGYGKTQEPEMTEEYYEIRAQYEKSLEDLDKKGKLKKKK